MSGLYVKWTDGDGKDHYVPIDIPMKHQSVVKGEYEDGWDRCREWYNRSAKRAIDNYIKDLNK